MLRHVWTTAAASAVFLCAVFVAALGTAPTAHGADCSRRSEIMALLADKYQEAPIGSGVTNSGALIEVYARADGGTWSIVVTYPNGQSCLLAAGEGWRSFTRPLQDPRA